LDHILDKGIVIVVWVREVAGGLGLGTGDDSKQGGGSADVRVLELRDSVSLALEASLNVRIGR